MPTSPIQLLYASTSGNTETVMEAVAAQLEQRGVRTHLQRAEQTPIEVVAQNQWFVFGTSTWEHGALNPFFVQLLKGIKTTDCQGKVAAFLGCGDRRYEPVLFCEGIEIVKRVWLAQQGVALGETLKIQGEAYGILDTVVKPWADRVAEQFLGLTTSDSNPPLEPGARTQNQNLTQKIHHLFKL